MQNKKQTVTWHQLSKSPETLKFPFILKLNGHNEVIQCEKIVRFLAKKRLVLFGKMHNKNVVIKLFLQPGRAQQHCQREIKGLNTLTESGILTASILFIGLTEKYKIPILVTEKIENTRDLASLWQNRSHPETTGRLMQAVTLELATQHVMGIRQRDLHFGNFLIKNHKIYTLDAGSIDFFYRPLRLKTSLHHLALFFSQLGAGTHTLRQHLFTLYCKSRGWQLKTENFAKLNRLTQKNLQKRLINYRKKVLRNSSPVKKIVYPFKKIYVDREFISPALNSFFLNPDALFQNSTLLKNGRSATVILCEIDQKLFVIKRYNIKGLFHWLRRCLRSTRAQKSWEYAHILRLAGIPTARPVAYLEKNFFGLAGKSYFMMEYIPGEDLANYFAKPIQDEENTRKLAKRIKHIFTQLTDIQVSHGDLKATNFIIQQEKPVLIDLDGMQQYATISETRRAAHKEMHRFKKNWQDQPDILALFEFESNSLSER